jgi:hypothetical protein
MTIRRYVAGNQENGVFKRNPSSGPQRVDDNGVKSINGIAGAPKTIKVWGSDHFIMRYYQRAMDLLPNIDPRHFHVTGYLFENVHSHRQYLDIKGVARLVVERRSWGYVGITIYSSRLKRIYKPGAQQ